MLVEEPLPNLSGVARATMAARGCFRIGSLDGGPVQMFGATIFVPPPIAPRTAELCWTRWGEESFDPKGE